MGLDSTISVIIPTYNRAHALGRAIQSVVEQTVTPHELIIVDDGSQDHTKEIVDHFIRNAPCRIRYIKTSNHGVSAARNLGIRESNSEWCAFLDSDDEWLADKLDRQLHMAMHHPDLSILHGEEIWIRNNVRVNPMKKHQKYGGMIYQQCLPLCCISPSAVMIRKSLLDHTGGFREDFPACEDYDLWLRLTAHNPVGFISDPIIKKYGGHDDQLSHRYPIMDRWRIDSMKSMLETETLTPPDYEATIQELQKKASIVIKGYRKHGRDHDADTLLKQLLPFYPLNNRCYAINRLLELQS